MVVIGLVPALRLRLRLRPTFRLPAGIGRWTGGLALVGLAEVAANEIATVVVIGLANGRGTTGALVLFSYAQQVFSTLSSVLVMSIVFSAFPVLSARRGAVFDRTCAGSARAVVLSAWLGVAVLAAIAVPAARVLAGRPAQTGELALGFLGFAPGLVGLGVIAILSRALLATGRLRIPAIAVAASSLVALAVQLVLVQVVPARLVVAALAAGNTIGVSAVAIPLVRVTRRELGPGAVTGLGRATAAGLAAAACGGLAGIAVSLGLAGGGRAVQAGTAAVAACCAIAVCAAAACWLEGGEVRAAVGRARRFAGQWVSREDSARPGPGETGDQGDQEDHGEPAGSPVATGRGLPARQPRGEKR
jgi:putative peptidoglycan lipid II flippase